MKIKALFLTLLLGALFASFAAFPAFADDCAATVSLYNGWARASVPGAPNSAAYGLLVNLTDEADTLVSASSDAAEMVELHEMSMTADGVMQMRPVEGGFPVAVRGFVALEPGGYHIMLLNLTRTLEPGSMVDLTLVFERAGEVQISVPVRDPDAMAGMGGMDMPDMEATAEAMGGMMPMEATPEMMTDAPCGVQVIDAWARPSIGGAPNSGAYLLLVNPDPAADALIGAESGVAQMVEIHEMSMTADGVMQMRPVEGQRLEIPAGGAARLMPGSYHIMLMGLTRELVAGDMFSLTLTFENAGAITLDVIVRDPDAEDSMNMGGM
jgi:copper(I)-binding protein